MSAFATAAGRERQSDSTSLVSRARAGEIGSTLDLVAQNMKLPARISRRSPPRHHYHKPAVLGHFAIGES
jgi:hypothetical protein